jgi:prephenate dehydratase
MPHSRKHIVAFQGELGAFSHTAALKLLGTSIKLLPCPTFRDAFQGLKDRSADYAVIPMENSLHGSIHENYDHLLEYGFWIAGETSLRISHQLIAMPGVRFSQIRKVLSHPVALNQCKQFLERHKSFQPIPHYDTAGSVKSLKEGKLADSAAIASETAAATYGGVILRHNIEDMRENFTRFFLLTKQPVTPKLVGRNSKTSLVFSTSNNAGALFRAMACFALRDLNLTKIESRPLRGKPWEYLFYVDFHGSVAEKSAQNALANLQEYAQFMKLLGSYTPTP